MVVSVKFALGIILLTLASAQENPVAVTSSGKIRGTILKTETGLDFFAFRGIKYAEAPIGDKRFKAPVAIKTTWDGEYDAQKDGFMCPQVGPSVKIMSEDCLVLNVYTRNLTASKSVIVYIHGGSNKDGGSQSEREAGPQYLMETDIVLVSLNYRLGALGFLSTRSTEAPGNFGYLDQVMALQWVHDNILNFGGNASSVTLLGFSAGGMAVTLHVASPLSKGLFHRAIAMSGSAVNEQAIDNLYWTRKLAHETSCPMFNPENVLSCLRKLTWQTIVEVTKKWDVYLADMKFNYEVDGHFMVDKPTECFAKGNFSRVPILTGLSKDEFNGIIYRHENNSAFLNDISLNLEKYASEFFMHNFGDSNQKKVEQLKTFYFKTDSINKENMINFGEAFSDSFINHGVHRLVDLARKYVDVYYYRFDYLGRFRVIANSKNVFHGDDQRYVFKINKFGGNQIGIKDKEWPMVETMVGIISSFAQTGTPPEFNGTKWIPSNATDINTLYINETVKMDSRPYPERFQLWDNLFPVKTSGSNCLTSTFMMTIVVMVFNTWMFK